MDRLDLIMRTAKLFKAVFDAIDKGELTKEVCEDAMGDSYLTVVDEFVKLHPEFKADWEATDNDEASNDGIIDSLFDLFIDGINERFPDFDPADWTDTEWDETPDAWFIKKD